MPAIPIRTAPDYEVINLVANQVVTDTAWNGVQNHLKHNNGRGRNGCTIQGQRNNSRLLPAIGTLGLGYNFSFELHGPVSIAVPVLIPFDYDRFSLLFSYRLNKMRKLSSGIEIGTNLTLQLVKGGSRFQILKRSWRDTLGSPSGSGFTQLNGRLNAGAVSSPNGVDFGYLVVIYDMVEGDTASIGGNSDFGFAASDW